MTTLYFEASDEDDLRKTGFSKDGKHHCPQIMTGLLMGLDGYLLGYDIYEGYTLIPFIKKISERFSLDRPTVIADSGLLSTQNIVALESDDYEYIIGARIKNESSGIKIKYLYQIIMTTQLLSLKKEATGDCLFLLQKTGLKRTGIIEKEGLNGSRSALNRAN